MKRKGIVLLLVVFALIALSSPTGAVYTPCTDQCLADYQAQRYACSHSGLPWQEAIQCINAAKAAYDECVANCQ